MFLAATAAATHVAAKLPWREWLGRVDRSGGVGGLLYSNVSCRKLFLCLGRANSREWDSNRVKLPPEILQSTVAIKKEV